MTLTTFTIAGSEYPAYATIAEADAYLAIDLQYSQTWNGLTDVRKMTLLAAATRLLDGLNWRGIRSAAGQATAWPRSGIRDAAGNAITGIPPDLRDATALQAVQSQVTPPVTSTGDDDIKMHQAGNVRFDRFDRRRPATIDATINNLTVRRLICHWLVRAESIPVADNTDGTPFYESRNPFGFTEGIS